MTLSMDLEAVALELREMMFPGRKKTLLGDFFDDQGTFIETEDLDENYDPLAFLNEKKRFYGGLAELSTDLPLIPYIAGKETQVKALIASIPDNQRQQFFNILCATLEGPQYPIAAMHSQSLNQNKEDEVEHTDLKRLIEEGASDAELNKIKQEISPGPYHETFMILPHRPFVEFSPISEDGPESSAYQKVGGEARLDSSSVFKWMHKEDSPEGTREVPKGYAQAFQMFEDYEHESVWVPSSPRHSFPDFQPVSPAIRPSYAGLLGTKVFACDITKIRSHLRCSEDLDGLDLAPGHIPLTRKLFEEAFRGQVLEAGHDLEYRHQVDVDHVLLGNLTAKNVWKSGQHSEGLLLIAASYLF